MKKISCSFHMIKVTKFHYFLALHLFWVGWLLHNRCTFCFMFSCAFLHPLQEAKHKDKMLSIIAFTTTRRTNKEQIDLSLTSVYRDKL